MKEATIEKAENGYLVRRSYLVGGSAGTTVHVTRRCTSSDKAVV